MTTAVPPTRFLHLVVGYDGSPPASRALDAAVRLLQGRIGRIEVVYVAHLSSLAALSPGAIARRCRSSSCPRGTTFHQQATAGMRLDGRVRV
jgi:hypothetical protein